MIPFPSRALRSGGLPARFVRLLLGACLLSGCASVDQGRYGITSVEIEGNEAVASTPDAFEQRFKADLAKFAKIVKEAHIPTQD